MDDLGLAREPAKLADRPVPVRGALDVEVVRRLAGAVERHDGQSGRLGRARGRAQIDVLGSGSVTQQLPETVVAEARHERRALAQTREGDGHVERTSAGVRLVIPGSFPGHEVDQGLPDHGDER